MAKVSILGECASSVIFWHFISSVCYITLIIYIQIQPKPRIDYTLKAVGGSLTAIPGLSDMIDVSINLMSNPFFFISFDFNFDLFLDASF